LASTKYWCRQNIGAGKTLASTECWHQQNVGVCAEASPYCFGPAKSAAADFSQTLLMFSSLKMLCSPVYMQSPNVVLPLAALLLWEDFLPLSTNLFVPARHAETSKILASTKYWCAAHRTFYILELCSICEGKV
jgi:hypothetical protein